MTEEPEEPQEQAGTSVKRQKPPANGSGGVPEPDAVESAKQQSGNIRRRRKREATETVEDFRHSEILRVHKSLGRICGANRRWWQLLKWMEWNKVFGALAILFWGGFIAAGLAMIPFLDLHPTHVAKREYKIAFILTGVFALLFTLFRAILRSKEIESVETVYEYVDEIVASYEDEEPDAQPHG